MSSQPGGKAGARALSLPALSLALTGWALLSSILAGRFGYRPGGVRCRDPPRRRDGHLDGVRLTSDVFRPKSAGRTPTILVRIPLDETLVNTAFASTVGWMWAERGYTVVIQGTRGRYGSTGRHHPFVHERRDGIETLWWIAQQPWYNGRIGMWGGSYFDYTQWAVADQVDPGPSALVIQICSTDLYRMFYPGGAFSLETALFWALRSRGDRDDPPSAAMLNRGVAGFPTQLIGSEAATRRSCGG
jgi:predicted acyl esterase